MSEHELGVTDNEIFEELCQAMGVPKEVWEHDERTWTVRDLEAIFDLGNAAARARAESAVQEGRFIRGSIKGESGHYIDAYRLAD